VHGAALLGEDNPDVPVCTDCHGVHNIAQATTAEFRLSLAADVRSVSCRRDLMDKYNISTDVIETYVADFHGTTTRSLIRSRPTRRQTRRSVMTVTAFTTSCRPPTKTRRSSSANLLVTCQQCHPDANANFPDSWTSHFKPSLEHYPLVYFVNLFYASSFRSTVGGFMLFIAPTSTGGWDRDRRAQGGTPLMQEPSISANPLRASRQASRQVPGSIPP
jgi:cytochrome c553